MNPRAIHQFHSGVQYGDGVSNSLFYIQTLLRQAGYASDIFAVDIDERIRDRVRYYTQLQPRPDEPLLVHYSLGTDVDKWIEEINSSKILVYHNITPSAFLPKNSDLWNLVLKGRRALHRWAKTSTFSGAIGLSEFNSDELRQFGFRDVRTNNLLVDLNRYRRLASAPLLRSVRDPSKILFVGRVAEHKGQLDLLHALRHLVAQHAAPVELHLVGEIGSTEYERACRTLVDEAGLAKIVKWHSQVEEEELAALYQDADLFLSLSRHEGFGMPLVEAMVFDVPVMALKRGAVAETLGSGGWGIDDVNPQEVAKAINLVLTEPQVRRRMINRQRENLKRFERSQIIPALETTLREFGFDVSLSGALAAELDIPPAKMWRVEGPCDSSYSLAIVNRNLAQALHRAGLRIGLLNRDNEQQYIASAEFLNENPDVAALLTAGKAAPVDVALRNQFPPYVTDMRGRLRVLSNFAWEESGFPVAWIEAFNQTLDLITVTSRFVAKVLRDSGVHTPIAIVGNGVDHLAGVQPDYAPPVPMTPGRFRFLHVSSCFPRKGVDVLLTAWAKAFTRDDPVELVIKSFPNPHNTIQADLENFAARWPQHAPIRLLMDELTPSAMAALYDSADSLVCPSRGEGFGLPLAEAGWRGKALVTTAYGGQADFCNEETAWLCDYSFATTQSHLGVLELGLAGAGPPQPSRRSQSRRGVPRRARAQRRRSEPDDPRALQVGSGGAQNYRRCS